MIRGQVCNRLMIGELYPIEGVLSICVKKWLWASLIFLSLDFLERSCYIIENESKGNSRRN